MHQAFADLARNAIVDAFVTPSPVATVDPALVTPGPAGFAVMALLTFAVVALIWDMVRRIRRGRVRADIREELDAEQLASSQARAAEEASNVDDQDVDAADSDAGVPPRG